jgi:hypothetical protein
MSCAGWGCVVKTMMRLKIFSSFLQKILAFHICCSLILSPFLFLPAYAQSVVDPSAGGNTHPANSRLDYLMDKYANYLLKEEILVHMGSTPSLYIISEKIPINGQDYYICKWCDPCKHFYDNDPLKTTSTLDKNDFFVKRYLENVAICQKRGTFKQTWTIYRAEVFEKFKNNYYYAPGYYNYLVRWGYVVLEFAGLEETLQFIDSTIENISKLPEKH